MRKNMCKKIINLLYMMSLFVVITACATATNLDQITDESIILDCENDAPVDSIPYNTNIPVDTKNDEDKTIVCTTHEENQSLCKTELEHCACSRLCEETYKQLREWTVEELGGIIVASSIFWRDWWYGRGRFAWEHKGYWICDVAPNIHHHVMYVELLPTSGFESLNDIRYYLLQFYTVAWVNTLLSCQFSPFIEYNDKLFIHVARICTVNFEWETATHTIINYVGCHIFVRSIVSIWWIDDFCKIINEPLKFYADNIHYFAFSNGRINSTSYCPLFWEPLPDAHEEARRFRIASSYE